ncbi:MAG: hypothetical protein K8W52_14210 [Deltaproteobacteria bacterium]|nr:hypothetical protein [Deltaproteobacteria bacterium]
MRASIGARHALHFSSSGSPEPPRLRTRARSTSMSENPEIRRPTTWVDRHGSSLVGLACFVILALLIAMQVAC